MQKTLIGVIIALVVSLGAIVYYFQNEKTSLLADSKALQEKLKSLSSSIENQRKATDNKGSKMILNQLSAAKSQINQLKSMIDSLNNENSKLKSASLANSIQHKPNQQLGELQSNYNQLKSAHDQLKSTHDQLKSAHGQLKSAHDQLKSTHDQLLTENMRFKKAEQAENDKQDKLQRRLDEAMESLAKLQKSGLQGVEVSRGKDSIEVSFVDKVLFGTVSASLSKKAQNTLRVVGQSIAGLSDKRIRIVGHADSRPIHQNYKDKYLSNWELSAARATSVLRFLVREQYLSPQHGEAVARSYYEPTGSNDTKTGRKDNRRVEILITPIMTANKPLTH